jgi:hypothetical protein
MEEQNELTIDGIADLGIAEVWKGNWPICTPPPSFWSWVCCRQLGYLLKDATMKTSVGLGKEEYAKLLYLAHKLGINRSEVIRRMIKAISIPHWDLLKEEVIAGIEKGESLEEILEEK